MEKKETVGWVRAGLHILFHIIATFLILVLLAPDEIVDMLLALGGGITISVELFMITGYALQQRGSRGRYVRAFEWFYKHVARHMIRKQELGRFSAMTSYLSGLLVIRYILPFPMIDCLYAMTVLSWGDPFARIGGILIGGRKLPGHMKKPGGKRWSGLMSFVLVSAAAMFLVDVAVELTGMSVITPKIIIAQYAAIMVGAWVEAYTPRWDNFCIAISSMLTFEGILYLLG
jgi:dolichol kinase